MAPDCIESERLAAWCAAIPGETLEERRSELLWRYLNRQVTEPGLELHLQSCEPCSTALERERTLLGARDSKARVVFAACPSAEEMLQYAERAAELGPWRRLEIKRHLDHCVMCREETAWATRTVAAPAKDAAPRPWFSWQWAWLAPAAAALAVVFAVVYPSYLGPRRYARYAHVPDIPYEAMRAEFAQTHPDQSPQFRTATELISIGEYQQGSQVLRELNAKYPQDPSVGFFLGYVAVREGRWPEAVVLCTRAEKRALDGYRCWYLANVALMAGDLPLARKEILHSKDHEPYKTSAIRLEQIVN